MNRGMLYLTHFGLSCLTFMSLSACGTTVGQNGAKINTIKMEGVIFVETKDEKDQPKIDEKAVFESVKPVLESESPAGYTLTEYKQIHFTDKKLPEVYALYRPTYVSEGETTTNVIRVYQFSAEDETWNLIYNL